MYVAYSQISIFSTKETKPKLAKEELICQAGTSRDQTFFEISEPRFQIGFPVIFWRLFRCLSSCYFMRKNLLKIKLFRRFQLDIFLVSHLSHFIKAVSGAFFFVKKHLNDDDLVTMTSSLWCHRCDVISTDIMTTWLVLNKVVKNSVLVLPGLYMQMPIFMYLTILYRLLTHMLEEKYSIVSWDQMECFKEKLGMLFQR